MTDRFMTPEIEEMVAFACSALTPCEVEQLMTKALPVAPSSTAIKRVIRDVGDFFEKRADGSRRSSLAMLLWPTAQTS
ncbi:MAG: hypothetical protein IPM29_03200 [Planctomycetes bacterium]|nr:hypothetical protein [Planctomycetota bacterium]